MAAPERLGHSGLRHAGSSLSTTTLGRYQIVDAIDRGGMGTVHLARAVGVGRFARPVALKLLHPHLACEPAVVSMFRAEARLVARISHPNVVDVLDVDVIGDQHVIAMRYVEGGSLRALLQAKNHNLPLRVALRIVHDTLLGLHAAHEARAEDGQPLAIVHRDVSPANILVDLEGVAQLTDFGVARARGATMSSQGGVKGKLRYLAPEQLRGGNIDRRVDVFAAGIVLWELITGRALFDAESDGEILQRVHDMPIEPPGATIAIDRVVLRALERDPARRFATADELAKALVLAAKGNLASPEEVAAVAREAFFAAVEERREKLALAAKMPTPALAKKRRWMAPMVAAVLMAIVLVVVGFLARDRAKVQVAAAAPPAVVVTPAVEPPPTPAPTIAVATPTAAPAPTVAVVAPPRKRHASRAPVHSAPTPPKGPYIPPAL